MTLDERFWRHRYKATSHAAMAGAATAGGWCLLELLSSDRLPWDTLSVLVAMAVTKAAAMIYYRLTD